MADNNYQAPVPAPAPQKNGMAIGALIAGIAAFVLSCVPILGFGGGIAGIVCGILGMKKGPTGKGMCIAGIILGALGIVGAIIWMVVGVAGLMVDYM